MKQFVLVNDNTLSRKDKILFGLDLPNLIGVEDAAVVRPAPERLHGLEVMNLLLFFQNY